MMLCRACDLKFRSKGAFKLDKGMAKNAGGVWVTALMPEGFDYGGGENVRL